MKNKKLKAKEHREGFSENTLVEEGVYVSFMFSDDNKNNQGHRPYHILPGNSSLVALKHACGGRVSVVIVNEGCPAI